MNIKQKTELDTLYTISKLKIGSYEANDIHKEAENKYKVIDKFAEYLKEKVKQDEAQMLTELVICTHCGARFVPIDPVEKKSTNREIVYTDAGWGDDDEIADVTRLIKTAICPVCKKDIIIEQKYISEANRRKLHGGI